MSVETRFRTDETGKHVRGDSPVDAPAQDPDIEEFDKKRAAGSEKRPHRVAGEPPSESQERHEKRPEGPYKEPADERKQSELK